MRRFTFLAAAACAALTAAPVAAQQNTAPSSTPSEMDSGGAAAPAAPAKPKKICRKGPPATTGSRVDGGRICKTKEEWERYYANRRG